MRPLDTCQRYLQGDRLHRVDISAQIMVFKIVLLYVASILFVLLF